MVKWFGPSAAVDAIRDCVILHGHYGWSEEVILQQLMRDVSNLEIADGTPQIQKLIIARRLLGRDAVD
jgi:cyclohexanecarboxyl-CoA dehydrogenase